MKSRAILAIALIGPMLPGCAHWLSAEDDAGNGSGAASPARPVDAYCQDIARHREDEASFQHEDDRTLEQVYAFTYKICADWRAKHLKQGKN